MLRLYELSTAELVDNICLDVNVGYEKNYSWRFTAGCVYLLSNDVHLFLLKQDNTRELFLQRTKEGSSKIFQLSKIAESTRERKEKKENLLENFFVVLNDLFSPEFKCDPLKYPLEPVGTTKSCFHIPLGGYERIFNKECKWCKKFISETCRHCGEKY